VTQGSLKVITSLAEGGKNVNNSLVLLGIVLKRIGIKKTKTVETLQLYVETSSPFKTPEKIKYFLFI
jgi:hypothetical protein